MKISPLLLFLIPLCLQGCAKHTTVRSSSAFLSPTVIEGRHASLDALVDDPKSTGGDLFNFAGQAEDALLRCNADKQSATNELNPKDH